MASPGAAAGSALEQPMSAAPPAPHNLPAPPGEWHSVGGQLSPAQAAAEDNLWKLVRHITELAPELSPASISRAATQIASLSPRPARHSATMEAAMQDEEPPRPQDLGARMDDEADHGQQAAGSGASVAAVDDEHDGSVERVEDGGPALWMPGMARLDVIGYNAGAGGVGDAFEREWAEATGAARGGGGGGGGDGGDGGNDGEDGDGEDDDGDDDDDDIPQPRAQSSEPLNLDPGQHLVCDACDLAEEGGRGSACMACDMQDASEVKDTIRKWTRKMEKRGALAEYPERRAPRYHTYRAVIKWKFADPLGAENRLILPECVKCAVRRLFPDPCCGEGCDYGVDCERKGHYTGHRTAAESRALRGETTGEDADAAADAND